MRCFSLASWERSLGLCLCRRDGTLLATNRPFAKMLGYESPAELQRVGGVLGVFARPEEQARVVFAPYCGSQRVLFRHKNGSRSTLEVLAAATGDQASAFLVVTEQLSGTHSPIRRD
jgi:PAS domain-containing protein